MRAKADISIMGCGWLGLPFAEELVKKGYQVKGSTTRTEKLPILEEKNINPYLINLQDADMNPADLDDFLNADLLLVNIPPKLRSDGGAGYLEQLHLLRNALLKSPVSKLLFVSSTSVYPDLNRVVTEEDSYYLSEKDASNALLQAEKLFQECEEWLATVVRFAGLVGPGRQPGRFFAGKKQVPNGDAPVNLIHLDDCIAIFLRILELEKWGQVYNACSDQHPLRKDFYTSAALAAGLEPPQFNLMTETNFKLINSQKLKDELSFVFQYPDPMTFF
ncbi:SDR family oxidoreductase [Pontibacter arcticus]|uniref:SDR family NAD(P)-dependent oxidoreductase n=1 Tax=Pontibacter arcticus TaxID=2080288 RepID=A0A364RG39_9BACT|nr:SDR family oxidoreductase [Pontibacter arcticus]RAU83136.1 SDR family NAD(P)-dependent oxidoreductase [Pontibacter arcticus]